MRKYWIVMAMLLAPAVQAQNFTTAAEVKPILGMTKGNWVAVREYAGKDHIYFSHLAAWRCGLDTVHYGLNGAAADTEFEFQPCHIDTATPNAILGDGVLPFFTAPLNSVETITVRVTYDDGTEETETFERKSVLIP